MVPLVEVTRRDIDTAVEVCESVHAGSLVLTDGRGQVQAALGDPEVVVFVRSAAKPFQATACLERLAAAGIPEPDDAEVAVAWASHRGEPRHLDAVRRLLARSATPETAVTCTPAVAEADPGAAPAVLTSNCSGKHALFALAGHDTPRDRLLDPHGPLQRDVLAVLTEVLGPARAVGVDGCGAPAVAVGLRALAEGYARLAYEPRWAVVRRAGLAHPGLVGGEGRLESALLGCGVLAKVGAEGIYGVGWLDDDHRAHGLAVKAADGADRGAAAVTAAVLEALGVVAPGTWTPPPPQGGGAAAGTIRPTPVLAALLADLPAGIGRGTTPGSGPVVNGW